MQSSHSDSAAIYAEGDRQFLWKVCLRLSLLIAIGLPASVGIGHCLGKWSHGQFNNFSTKRRLYELAQEQVLARLKCPSTAVFPPLDDPRVDVLVFTDRGQWGDFSVRSFVDAQNDYGAMFRVKWSGEFLRDGRVYDNSLRLEE